MEDMFGSKGRILVLRTLVEEGEMNISQLARRVGMNHTTVDQHCERLIVLGLLREKRYDRIRILEVAFHEFEIRFKKGYGLDFSVNNGDLG